MSDAAIPSLSGEEEQSIVADDGEADEGFDPGSDRSSLTSIASQIRQGIVENGRVYAAYGKGEYGLPRDEREMERIDMAHEKYFLLLDEKRYLAPIGPNPQQILDLGTGTGIWAMDIADQFPSAQVLGIDIAPIQPTWVPPNCAFEVDDIEAPWTFKKESFDYIFARDLLFSIRNFPRLIEQCYEHLKPGGWVEFECIFGVLGCDDGTLPENGSFRQYDKLVREAAVAFGTPLEDPGKFKEWFEAAGFEAVVERRFKIPSNPWPKDKRMKMVGIFERENFLNGLEAMSLRLFQKGLGWSAEETSVLLAKVRSEIKNTAYHAYYPFYVVYGRKPGTTKT
ncbi:hypothetical protein M433DRAFT_177045 [Acidomyces richmondensis BFW]|nr:hypothetical protein M433DRAFT_177045 [Acidomyces richmondensis BFW]